MPAPRLSIVDPSLRDAAGHNLDYARLVGWDARRAGIGVRAFGALQATISEKSLGYPFTPVFERGLKDEAAVAFACLRATVRALKRSARLSPNEAMRALRDERALRARGISFGLAFADLMARLSPHAYERVFLPNATWADGAAVADVVAAGGLREAGALDILLRFDPPQSLPARRALSLSAMRAGRRVRWWSDTRALAELYAGLLRQPVGVAAIPIDCEAIDRACAARAPHAGVVVGYFGEARREKGFHLLPRLIERALSAAPDARFIVQVVHNIAGGEDGCVAAAKRLARLPADRVRLIEGALPSDDLLREIAACNVLLLPYDGAAYRLRSSGLAALFAAAGGVVVAPRGVAFAASELTETFVNAQDLVPAALRAIARAAPLSPARRRPMEQIGERFWAQPVNATQTADAASQTARAVAIS